MNFVPPLPPLMDIKVALTCDLNIKKQSTGSLDDILIVLYGGKISGDYKLVPSCHRRTKQTRFDEIIRKRKEFSK